MHKHTLNNIKSLWGILNLYSKVGRFKNTFQRLLIIQNISVWMFNKRDRDGEKNLTYITPRERYRKNKNCKYYLYLYFRCIALHRPAFVVFTVCMPFHVHCAHFLLWHWLDRGKVWSTERSTLLPQNYVYVECVQPLSSSSVCCPCFLCYLAPRRLLDYFLSDEWVVGVAAAFGAVLLL